MTIPKKYATGVFVFLISLLMSFALTIINLGFTKDFMEHWTQAFFLSFPIALIASYLVMPPIRQLVDAFTV